MTPKKVYVFDLDGTIANIDHRLYLIKGEKKDWPAFFDACDKDTPVEWIVHLLRVLAASGQILILSGRNREVLKKTQDWLEKHRVTHDWLEMRPRKDHRPDDVLKIEMLRGWMGCNPEHEVAFIVDDRQRVVDMWRREGFNVLQCQAWEEKP